MRSCDAASAAVPRGAHAAACALAAVLGTVTHALASDALGVVPARQICAVLCCAVLRCVRVRACLSALGWDGSVGSEALAIAQVCVPRWHGRTVLHGLRLFAGRALGFRVRPVFSHCTGPQLIRGPWGPGPQNGLWGMVVLMSVLAAGPAD
jgi:hypothetical protein